MDRIFSGNPRELIDDMEYFLERLADGRLLRPSAQLFGNVVQQGNFSLGIGCNDAVADATEGDCKSLLFLRQGCLGKLALGDILSDGLILADRACLIK